MKKAINYFALFLLLFAYVVNAQDNPKLKAIYESVSAEKIGDYDKAISVMMKDYNNWKNDYVYNLRLGWLNYLKGDFPVSLNYYKKAIKLSNKSIESLLGITYPYSKMNKKDKLKKVYNEILKKAPSNYTANLNLALLYFNEGDYLNSMIYLEKLAKDYPSDYTVNLYLGWANYYEGGNKKAHKYFERALIAVPNDPSAKKGYDATK